MIYNIMEEIPNWAKPTIERLVHNGIIAYEEQFEFPLTEDILRICVILARIGMF